MSTKTIISFTVAIIAISFAVAAWIVNREDTVRMEIAAQNGLIQCQQGNYVLWKKICN